MDRPATLRTDATFSTTDKALPAAALPAAARWPCGATAAATAANKRGEQAAAVSGKMETLPVASTGKAWGAKGKKAIVPSGAIVTGQMKGQIQQLKEMGFSEKHAREALVECVWDVNKALDLLFTRGVPMGEGEAESSADARSPEKAANSAAPNSPDSTAPTGTGADSTERSTTASTASSPRSSADKLSSGHATGVSAPHSPESHSPAGSSGAILATAAAEEAAEVAGEADSAERPTEAADTCEEKAEELTQDEKVTCAEEASGEEVAKVEASPEKRLTRVSGAWESEGAGAQLHVKEGDFVWVWLSSITEHGWIYAEDSLHADRAGWLPGCVLEELPSNQRWMKATQDMQAAHETQLSAVEGEVYKVSIDSRTTEGWIYAEASRATTESAGDVAEGQQGWVPVFCLEGAADLEQ